MAQKPEQSATDDDPIIASLEEIKLMLRAILEKGTGDEDPNATGDEDPDATGDEDAPIEATGDEDETAPAKDRLTVRTADADIVSRAHMLAPALRARIGDNALAVKRAALQHAFRDQTIRDVIAPIIGRQQINKLPHVTLDAAFMAASGVAKVKNNHRTADALTSRGRDSQPRGNTPADLNAANAAYRAVLEGRL